ncbi:hypothetical protein [Methanosarcina sp. Kolksee]|nr:hypothetical protein [Methanosarcina sp. Kolksee]
MKNKRSARMPEKLNLVPGEKLVRDCTVRGNGSCEITHNRKNN